MNLTKQEQYFLFLLVTLLLIGSAVKYYRDKHPLGQAVEKLSP